MSKTGCLVRVLLAMLPAACLCGQGPAPEGVGKGKGPARPDPLITFRTRHFFSAGSDFEHRQGGFSLYGGEVELSLTKRISPRGALGLSLARGLYRLDFQNETDLVPGNPEPFDLLHSTTLGFSYRHIFDRRWGAMGRFSLQLGREEGGDFGDSLDGFLMAGARYQWTDDFALSFGLVGLTRMEEHPLAFPAVMVEWNITEQLKLEMTRDLRLTCDLGGGWEVWTGLGFQGDYFRLDEDNVLPGGIVRITRVPFRLGLDWSPGGPGLRLGSYLGWSFAQELTIWDHQGRKLQQEKREGSLEAGLRLRVSF